MNETILAALIGASGGFVVWLLSWLWTLWTERRQAGRIRTIVSIEIDDNLADLRSVSEAARTRVTLANAPQLANVQRLDALAGLQVPRPRHSMLQALAASLPVALTKPEIRSVCQLHRELDDLFSMNEALGPSGPGERKRQLDAKLASLLQAGNPIGR